MKRDATERRRRAYGLGRRAEWAAMAVLILSGYRILGRRYLAPGGEIDLVGRRGDTVIFVEVKARPTLEQAMTSITATKQQRLSVAAAHWLTRNPWAATYNLRGDAVFVGGWRWPKHQIAAFEIKFR